MKNDKVLSVSEQVEKIILERITEGKYPINSRLPAEVELAKELGVSRATVRTVFSKLEARALISRKHGFGTFVNSDVVELNVIPKGFWTFHHWIEKSGRTATASVKSISLRVVKKQEVDILQISSGERVYEAEVLFLANHKPVIHSVCIYPEKFFVSENDQYDFSEPLNEFLQNYCNQEIARSFSDLDAVIPPVFILNHLNLPIRSPVLKFITIYYNQQNQPLVYAISYYSDKLIRLNINQNF